MTVTEQSTERSAAPPARSSHRRSSRRRRRRRSPVVPLLIGAAVTSGAALAVYVRVTRRRRRRTVGGPRRTPASASRSPDGRLRPRPPRRRRPPSRSSRDAGTSAPHRTRLAPPLPAAHGTGTFVTAKSSGKVIGDGSDVRRFKVQVEEGTGVDPKKAAAEISAVLADERGWTRDRKHSFQLVSGGAYDFEVKIATPDTVDDICG